jgi:D-glycerate 3-kinase
MTDAQVAEFVRHYERLTRHTASEMPARADIVIRLGPARETPA